MFKLTFCAAILVSVCHANVLEQFSVDNARITANIYQELAKTETGNFLVCPISVETAMAMTGFGAAGETARQISRGLGLPQNPADVELLFRELAPKLRGTEYYALNSANKIYVKDGYRIKPAFRNVSTVLFNAGIDNVDFTDNVNTAGTINKWVEEKTNNKIQNLVSPDMLTADTRLVLVNALYFKAAWETPFTKYATRQMPFHSAKGTADVDMMTVKDQFRYCENAELDAKFLEMPFKGGDVSMVIVLPNQRNGLAALEARMEEVVKPQTYTHESVLVNLPKFKIETTIQFKKILQKLGVVDAFTPSADFSGIADDTLYIDTVIQKTFMDLNEDGVEAAAATAVEIAVLGNFHDDNVEKKQFIADHSFLYKIRYRNFVDMFIGRYNSQ